MKTLHIELDKIDSCEVLKTLQEEVNKTFNEKLEELSIKEKANNLSNKSFGFIKESFENLSGLLVESNKGKSIIKEYIDTIKKNKDLGILHTIYENLRKTGSDSDVDYFVNRIIVNKVNSKTIKEDIKKLGDVLGKAYCFLGKSADSLLGEENERLDSAISYILEHKETNKNLSEYSAAISILKEDINKRESSVDFLNVKDIDEVAIDLVKEFNEKYSDLLTEEEKQVVSEIAKSNSPEDVFNKYKSICEEKMSTKKKEFEDSGDLESAKRVSSISEQIKNKKYSVDTLVDDINNIFEITKIFE